MAPRALSLTARRGVDQGGAPSAAAAPTLLPLRAERRFEASRGVPIGVWASGSNSAQVPMAATAMERLVPQLAVGTGSTELAGRATCAGLASA